MKRYTLVLMCLLYSIIGISQDTWTEITSDAPIVGGLYDWACDSIGYESSWESDCINDANYYVDYFNVPAGATLTSIDIDISEVDMLTESNYPHFAYSLYFPGSFIEGEANPISRSDYTVPGIMIIDSDNGNILEYITRYELAFINEGVFTIDTDFWQGNYEIRVINECLFDTADWNEYFSVTSGVSPFCFDNYPDFCIINQGAIEVFSNPEGVYPIKSSGEDIVVSSISYNLEGTGYYEEWYEVQESLPVVENPYSWACDSLQWDSQGWGSDCICNAKYYIDTLVIPEGAILKDFYVNIAANYTQSTTYHEVLEEDYTYTYWDYSIEFQNTGAGYGETFGTTAAFNIRDIDTQESVFNQPRSIFHDNDSGSDQFLYENLDLEAGTYIVTIINESLLENVYWEPNDFEFSNWPGFFLEDYDYTYENGFQQDLADNGYDIQLNEWMNLADEPDVILDDVIYVFEALIPEVVLESQYNACDGEELSFEAGCISGVLEEAFSYEWQIYLDEVESWYTLANDTTCTLSRVFQYDTAAVDAVNEFDYRVINRFFFTDSIINEFQIQVYPIPEWDYIVSTVTYNELGEVLIFDLEIPEETQNFESSDITDGYNWSVNSGFEGVDMELEFLDETGHSCTWLCNPFQAEVDSISSYVVDVTLASGCSAQDTTYVMFIDSNENGLWDEGDSLDVRSFLFIQEDTTVVDTTVFVRELVGKNIKLYPNPTNSSLTLEHDFNGQIVFRIYSTTGAVVRDEQITSPIYQTSVADLQKGIYIITLSDGQETLTSRLIKTE